MIKLFKLLFINALWFLGFFLILELGARTYVHIFVEGKYFFRDSTFISPWITSYDYPTPLIDSNGMGYFRHKDLPVHKSKPDNHFRIIAVGGSTTLNQRPFAVSGIDYPLALESLLNKSSNGKIYEVLNAGADGYSTAQSLINIQFRLIDFNPDMILLMHNINDLTVNYFEDGATADYGNKYMSPYFLNPELQAIRSVPGMLFQSRLLTKLRLPEYLASLKSIDYTNNISAGANYFQRNLSSIASICKQNKIKLVLLTQPNLMDNFQFEGQADQVIQFNSLVKKVGEIESIPVIDMFKIFGHDRKYFIDYVHYTPEGIQRFSDLLMRELAALDFGIVINWVNGHED